MPKKLRKRPQSRGGRTLPSTVRVVFYERVSTDETNQPYSMPAQDHGLRAFVESQRGWVHVGTYRDEASGTLPPEKRPGLAQLLADAEAGKFDLVLVQRVDRMARSVVVLRDIIARLTDLEVVFRSATQAFDTSDAFGTLILTLLGMVAEFERDLLIDRILAGIAEKTRQGRWRGGPAPYGYRLVNKALERHPKEAAVVELIFRLYVQDHLGYAAIRRWLNERGYRTRTGKPWSSKNISDIVGGWVYAGYITHWDKVHAGIHPALVDRETWDAAQALSAQRAERSQRQRADSPYRFSHLLRCEKCGSSLVGTAAHGRGGRYRYYTCNRRIQQGVEFCDLPVLDADDVDRTLVEALVALYRNDALFIDAARAALDAQTSRRPQLEAELTAHRAQLADVQDRLDGWYRRVEEGGVEEELVADRLQKLVNERAQVTNRIDELELQLATSLGDLPDLEEVHRLAGQVEEVLSGPTTPAVKAFLATLVEVVNVGADRVLRPVFRVPGTLLALQPPATAGDEAQGAPGLAHTAAICSDSVTGSGARGI